MTFILTAVLVLGVTGLVLGLVLYAVSRKFKVEEDPRVGQITELLPGANCGGCGFPGCAAFAAACVKADSMDGLKCTVCKSEVMQQIADITGHTVEVGVEKIAVVRCNGSCQNRPRPRTYDGARSCAVAAMMNGGGAPWLLYGIGAAIAIILTLLKIPALPFALGMFIPIDLNLPLLVGGRRLRQGLPASDH